jgi:methionyl-tRNA formyltransferase
MPLFEVLRYQEKETAVSVHFMNEEFDKGALILQEKVAITTNETYGGLALKLSDRTAMVALNVAQMLQFGNRIPRTEQESGFARYFEKPEPMDTFIQWKRMTAPEILSLINACNPWNQGADSVFMGDQVKLIVAAMSEENHSEVPGTIVKATDQYISVACLGGNCIDVHVIGGDQGIITAQQFNAVRSAVGHRFN